MSDEDRDLACVWVAADLSIGVLLAGLFMTPDLWAGSRVKQLLRYHRAAVFVWGWVSLYDSRRFRLIESAGFAVKPMNDPFTSRLTLTLPGESCSYLSGLLREQERGIVM